ncbi:MAG: AAA family ATPase [bacterium]|nr:AAA family ATPase [bacterium]
MKALNSDKNLSEIILKGFKSIVHCQLELGSLNVMIGCNGAGKSNFISFFHMIQQLLEGRLQAYVGRQGGPDALLHFGRKQTPQLEARLNLGAGGYSCTLAPTHDNRLMLDNEVFYVPEKEPQKFGTGHFESRIAESTDASRALFKPPVLMNWGVYHFFDTGDTALEKQMRGINDNMYLRPDASNLAAYLYLLQKKYPKYFNRIEKTIQLAAPFFDRFHLRPSPQNMDSIELEWFEKSSKVPFKAHYLSDGTLRFICLTTLLLQPPENQPETMLVDEPELGLHPYAVTLLAAMIQSVATKKQLIISTQSVDLIDEFDVEDIIVVDRKAGKSIFRRLKEENFEQWLKEYSIGELWKKNIFGGRPE